MNAQLLMRLPQARNAPVVTKAAQAIASAAASQAQMIDDLLDLSRVNTGKVVLDRVQVVLNEVIERIASAVENDVAAKGLSLHVSLGERLPCRLISCGSSRSSGTSSPTRSSSRRRGAASGSPCRAMTPGHGWRSATPASDSRRTISTRVRDLSAGRFRYAPQEDRPWHRAGGRQAAGGTISRPSRSRGCARGRSATCAGSRLQCASGEALDAGSFEGRDRSAGADGPLSGGRDCHAVSTSRRRSSC